jgi:hypothetical protein
LAIGPSPIELTFSSDPSGATAMALRAEQSLGQVRRPDHPAVGDREAQVGNARHQ